MRGDGGPNPCVMYAVTLPPRHPPRLSPLHWASANAGFPRPLALPAAPVLHIQPLRPPGLRLLRRRREEGEAGELCQSEGPGGTGGPWFSGEGGNLVPTPEGGGLVSERAPGSFPRWSTESGCKPQEEQPAGLDSTSAPLGSRKPRAHTR